MEKDQSVHRLLTALSVKDSRGLEASLHDDVTLRVWRWDGLISTRGRERVADWLAEEWRGWSDATLHTFPLLVDNQRTAIEFRIQATEDGRYVEHNRALFATLEDGQAATIDLYCGEPVVSARREGYIAPPTLTDAEIAAFLEASAGVFDPREYVGPNWLHHSSLRLSHGGSGDAHPGSNYVGQAHWTDAEADSRIEAVIAEHQARNIGFEWWVGPYDTPSDLPQRLERHGLLLAGTNARMARVGLDDLNDIPENDRVIIEMLDGTDDDSIEALLQVAAECFHMPPEQVDNLRPEWIERTKDPERRKKEVRVLARLDGVPVAMGLMNLRNGRAYLGGAATLPDYRGQHIYSTLLKHRLAIARLRGFHIAAIDAGPMSRRVVEKYGFEYFGSIFVYGWMPVMDPEVIKTLVPDE